MVRGAVWVAAVDAPALWPAAAAAAEPFEAVESAEQPLRSSVPARAAPLRRRVRGRSRELYTVD
jgi:hypothetical protein